MFSLKRRFNTLIFKFPAFQYHAKYQCKSRSDNSPHIYSVADSAYQDVLHHEESQHVIFSGESNSGKTTNMLHLIRHLMFLGKVALYHNITTKLVTTFSVTCSFLLQVSHFFVTLLGDLLLQSG